VFFVNFALQTQEWGEVLFSRILPVGDDNWGCCRPLCGTPWGDGLVVVSGDDLSHALHGRALPLLRTLGVPPEVRLRRIPSDWRPCAGQRGCITYQQEFCQPCLKMPGCFVPPELSGEAVILASSVALAWRDGRYVIRVEGSEFVV